MDPVTPQQPPLDLPATLLVRGGSPTDGPPHTLDAFRRSVEQGADGIESTVWLSADGRAVLDATGDVGGRFRRRPISAVASADLPEHVVTLDDLYADLGPAVVVALEVGDPAAIDEVLGVAEKAGAGGSLWISHHDHDLLAQVRESSDTVRLVNTVRLADLPAGAERRCAELRAVGVDALALPFPEWTAGTVALCHRFRRYAHASEATHERMARAVWDMGIDAISGSYVERLMVLRPSPDGSSDGTAP